jgi:undecaprenyl-diphosphatase
VRCYGRDIDWTAFHFLNEAFRGHALIEDEIGDFVSAWAVPLFAAATIGLWFLDRPGPWYRWKVASLAGMMAAGLGLLVSQVITHVWQRPRPYAAHPYDTILLVAPSNEPSFPSDHAVAAFAIAFTVAVVGRRMGALFLAGATVIGLTRILAGLHYPGDVLAGAAIGFLSAALVVWLASDYLPPVVRLASRLSDPLVSPAWRALDRAKERRRRRPIT